MHHEFTWYFCTLKKKKWAKHPILWAPFKLPQFFYSELSSNNTPLSHYHTLSLGFPYPATILRSLLQPSPVSSLTSFSFSLTNLAHHLSYSIWIAYSVLYILCETIVSKKQGLHNCHGIPALSIIVLYKQSTIKNSSTQNISLTNYYGQTSCWIPRIWWSENRNSALPSQSL